MVKRDKLGRFTKECVGKENIFYGRNHKEETKIEQGKVIKEKWKQPGYRENQIEKRKGQHNSPKTEFKKGYNSLRKGLTLEEEYGNKKSEEIRKKIKEERANQIFPKKDSSIEVKIQNFLKQLRIEFFTHQYISQIKHSYQCDILIPIMNLIIECDGDFIHCNPAKYPSDFVRFPNSENNQPAYVIWKRDKIRTKELIEKGFKVLRLWEFEINEMSINEFKNRIEKFK